MFIPHQRHIGHYFHEHRIMNVIAGNVVVMSDLAVILLGSALGKSLVNIFAQAPCPVGDQAYSVMESDTLSSIAASHNGTWQELAQHNTITNPHLISAGQTLCLPGKPGGGQMAQPPAHAALPDGSTGSCNLFPYGQCTYWADERYHQLSAFISLG